MLLTAPLSTRLSWTPAELSRWSREQAVFCARLGPEAAEYVCKEFGISAHGDTPEIRYRRASDPAFWRRAAASVLRVSQEFEAFKAGQVGAHSAHKYASQAAHDWHAHSEKANAEFLKKSAVFNRETGSVLPLSEVARTKQMHAAMQYAKLKAMQVLAVEAGLGWSMITLTLPATYHPNPSKGAKSWDETMPAEANNELVSRFNKLRSQLRKHNIVLSGFRVEEPHADGCPHWHLFVFYKPEHFERIAHSLLTQFPGGLRIRRAIASRPLEDGKFRLIFDTVVFENSAAFAAGVSLPASTPAQAQLDVGSTLDGSASFASYALKYVFKYAYAADSAESSDDFPAGELGPELPEASPALAAISAHRAAHRIRGLQFFGVPKVNDGWELLRQIDLSVDEFDESGRKPAPELVAEYAALCQQASGAGMPEFMRQLGGLAVAPLAPTVEIKALKTEKSNKYGEKAYKTLGISITRGAEFVAYRFRSENSLHSLKSAKALAAVFGKSPTWESPVFGEGALVQLDITKTLLTAQQALAIRASIYANNIVSATAGAGKTRVLVERAQFLIRNGIPANKIWVATFTTKAAQELAERFAAAGVPVESVTDYGVRIGTIHSLAAQDLVDARADFAVISGYDACIEASIALNRKRRHLLLDEAQDCSAQQWRWAAAVGETVFAVGDFRQSIYGWRGADAAGFEQFVAECFKSGGSEYKISVNTRCAANIVAVSNKLMLEYEPAAATREGGDVKVFVGLDFDDEAQAVLDFARSAAGTKAVLCRGNNGVARITALLRLEGIEDVAVTTIHAAKGLEYDAVCVALGERSDTEDGDQSSEIMYVAATRAREQLAYVSVGALPELLQNALY